MKSSVFPCLASDSYDFTQSGAVYLESSVPGSFVDISSSEFIFSSYTVQGNGGKYFSVKFTKF